MDQNNARARSKLSFRQLLVASVMVSGSALALDPAPVNRGSPIEFVPTLSLSQGYDDNINQDPAGDEESSNVTRIWPNFLLRAQSRANRYQFSYRPRIFLYSHESDDNRADHLLNGRAQWEFNGRNRLRLSTDASRTQAILNDTNRTAGEDEGDINEKLSLDAIHTFGAQDARGQLEFRAGHLWNRYANNLTTVETEEGRVGSNKQSKEYDSLRLGTTFFLRVAPKTRALVEGRYESFDYLWAPSTLDSENIGARVGLTWQATAKTSGSVRIGRLEKDFDDAAKADEQITDWQAQLSWNPVEHATFRLQTQNSLEEGGESSEAVVTEEAIEQTRWSINWEHAWDERWKSTLGYSIADRDYLASTGDNVGRVDETTTLSLKLDYEIQRWLAFGFEVQVKDKDSSRGPASSYEQNTYFFTVNVSL